MLPSFEDFDGHSEKARSFLPWLLQEIYLRRLKPVHNEPPAITAAQIEKATVRDYWMNRKNLYRRKKWFPERTFKKLEKQIKDDWAQVKVRVPGLKGVEVRAMVNYLRDKHNFPIGSSGKGYYFIVSQEDQQVTLDHLRGRINAMEAAYNGVLNADRTKSVNDLLHMDGQGIEQDMFGTTKMKASNWGDDFICHEGTPWSVR